jgi:prevent-host-death family protein
MVIDLIIYLVHYLVMTKINIHEAKTHLSRYLEQVERGETVVVCKRNLPVAEIRPISSRRIKAREIGLARGTFNVPSSFFEDLPDDLLAGFSGAGK